MSVITGEGEVGGVYDCGVAGFHQGIFVWGGGELGRGHSPKRQTGGQKILNFRAPETQYRE